MRLFDTHARLTLVALTILIGPLLAILVLIPISEGAVGKGQIAYSQTHLDIQVERLAEVEALLVKEGQRVQEGQELLHLAAPEAEAAWQKAALEQVQAQATLARLAVEDGHADLGIFDTISTKPEHQTLLAEQRALAVSNDRARTAERRQIQTSIGAARVQSDALAARKRGLTHRTALRAEALDRTVQLVGQGVHPQSSLDEAQDALLASQSALELLNQDQLSMSQQFENAEAALVAFEAGINAQRQGDRTTAQAKLARAQQDLNKWAAFLDRQIIRAPYDGIVQGLDQLSGDVVAPGQVLFRLAPQVANLQLTADFSAMDADRVTKGMGVLFTIPALVDQNIGPLGGQVLTMDETARIDAQGRPTYRAHITLSDRAKQVLKNTQIRAGMQVDLSLLSGERTLLAYLTDPIRRSFQTAIREE